jgi:hypothetical protein
MQVWAFCVVCFLTGNGKTEVKTSVFLSSCWEKRESEKMGPYNSTWCFKSTDVSAVQYIEGKHSRGATSGRSCGGGVN